ncbi:uncharacterized protein KIAA2012 homolog isoform X2 [Polyodon spathula]|uniref:uncharacterized protein KIAA2012 homolog isoform X2 n=1 Tax=Polyodon spathula TaxID=7913 RepID=UPI001B7F64D5|nr:uncharacterized protein KIAA2012 homolog isoform X2 [Polyodon spathula]
MSKLPLLSRGINNGQEKLEVFLESKEYLNLNRRLAHSSEKLYLPPLHHVTAPYQITSKQKPRVVPVTKMIATKKGALALYSEDLAIKAEKIKPKRRRKEKGAESLSRDVTEQLQTLSSLTNAILKYRCHQNHSSLLLVDPNSALHEDCRMQPGYSAKCYLSSWSVNLDKKTLNKLKDAVHMSDNTHFKNQPEDQHLYQPLYDDLSAAPKPLRVHLPRVSLLDYADLAEEGDPYTTEKFQFHPDNGALSQSINSNRGLLLNTECYGMEGSSNEQKIRKQAGSHIKNKHRDLLRKGLSDRLSPGPVMYIQWNHTEGNQNFASFYGGCLRGSRRAISVRLPPLLRPRDSSSEGHPGVSVEKGKDCGTSSRYNNDKWNSSSESNKLHTAEKYEHGTAKEVETNSFSKVSMESLMMLKQAMERAAAEHGILPSGLQVDMNTQSEILKGSLFRSCEEIGDRVTQNRKLPTLDSTCMAEEKSFKCTQEDDTPTGSGNELGTQAAFLKHLGHTNSLQPKQQICSADLQMPTADKQQTSSGDNGRTPAQMQDMRQNCSPSGVQTATEVNPPHQLTDEDQLLQQLMQYTNSVKSKKEQKGRGKKNSTAKGGSKTTSTKKAEHIVGKPRVKQQSESFQKAPEKVFPTDPKNEDLEKPVDLPECPAEPQQEEKRPASSEHSISSEQSQEELQEGDSKGNAEEKWRQAREKRDLKRVQQAEWRRLEVERKRQEKEMQRRKEMEEKEQEERMKEELQEQVMKKVQEHQERKKREAEERRQREEEEEVLRQEEMKQQAREHRRLEEHRRKLLELQRKKWEAEQLREAEAERKRMEEEEKLAEEQALLAAMEEEERKEYLRRKHEEEERRNKEEKMRRQQQEEEERKRMKEARQEAERIIREQWETESRLQFHRELLLEAAGLEKTQEVNRPWICSYYDVLRLLVLEHDRQHE